FVRVMDNANGAGPRLDDELWVRTVYGFATAIQHGRAALDHMADMFVPLYMWRAAAFMSDTAPDPPVAVQTRLAALRVTFHRLKTARGAERCQAFRCVRTATRRAHDHRGRWLSDGAARSARDSARPGLDELRWL